MTGFPDPNTVQSIAGGWNLAYCRCSMTESWKEQP